MCTNHLLYHADKLYNVLAQSFDLICIEHNSARAVGTKSQMD